VINSLKVVYTTGNISGAYTFKNVTFIGNYHSQNSCMSYC